MEVLNPNQQEAVNHIDGPLLVLAGAGSGKTRIVTSRIIKLLEQGVPESAILGLTFTNKAAGEMRNRVNVKTQSNVTVCTFHSLGAKILREAIEVLDNYARSFIIYDTEDCDRVLKAILKDAEISSKDAKPKDFRQRISKEKNALIAPGQLEELQGDSIVDQRLGAVYTLYQEKLRAYNALDFDDLLYLPVRLFREHPHILQSYQQRWRYLLIDEYQDTNAAQYQLATMLAGTACNLCVVGDPDQSIYSWRGANINNILNFEADFPGAKVVRLEQNYRSCETILNASNALIINNEDRYEKNLWSQRGTGEKISLFMANNERDEAEYVVDELRYYCEEKGVSWDEVAIFYRTNAQSRIFEDAFLSCRIPYVVVGGISFYQRREIKDLLAFLRMLHSGRDFVSFARTVNLPKRGLGDATIQKIRLFAEGQDYDFVELCRFLISGEATGIRLTKKHREGLADYVEFFSDLRSFYQENSLSDTVQYLIARSGYLDVLRTDPESYDDRKENIDQLVFKTIEWEQKEEENTLSALLEELALKSTADDVDDDEASVSLMTIHNSKGLEFQLAFIVGLEEGLFPHMNSLKDGENGMEEERRLCYVGMTRAKDKLHLCSASQRFLWGSSSHMRPSRFLYEVTKKYITKAL